MRILQLCKFFHPVPGGIESVVKTLVDGLVHQKVSCDVLCANTTKETTVERIGASTVIRAGSMGRVLSTSMSWKMIWELYKIKNSYTIIHVHLPDPLTNLALFLVRPSAKIIVHWHSDIVNQVQALKIYAPLQKWLLNKAESIVATSDAYAKSSPWLQKFSDKVRIIPIGIDVNLQKHGEIDQAVLKHLINKKRSGSKIIFSLGRMTYYKGFNILIEACRRLPAESIVCIGGAGELESTYQSMIKSYGLEQRVFMLGRLSDQQVVALFDLCDIFCLPSIARSEAFGVVLLEAMAHGKPVVATDIEGSGVPWVNQHGETGLNAPVGNPEALANALIKLLEDQDLADQMGRNAYRRYLEFFTAQSMLKNTQQLYQEVLNS